MATKFKTVYPESPCKSFNEWCVYVRKSTDDALLSDVARLDIEAEAFVKKIKQSFLKNRNR